MHLLPQVVQGEMVIVVEGPAEMQEVQDHLVEAVEAVAHRR
jgi:hypothetical protein